MVVINKKIKLILIASLIISIQLFSSIFSKPTLSKPILNLVEDIYSNFTIEINEDSLKNKSARCQTLAYLNNTELRKGAERKHATKIQNIGKEKFQELINSLILKEEEFKNSHYTFYHGQKREFLLIQDLFEALEKIIHKKALKDFIMLRIPDKDFEKFKSIIHFLHEHINNKEIKDWDFDEKKHIKKILLSVNPSLFGNNYYNLGECTFSYFINSSNASFIDCSQLIKNTFSYFNISNLYEKHKTRLENLNLILSDSEYNKTGILLQILVPHNIVDKVSYRCESWGRLYYQDNIPEAHPASKDLEEVKNAPLSDTLTTNYLQPYDAIQFRLLLNKEIMLNPDSGVKIFRYYNETENTKIYKQQFDELISQISKDILESKVKNA